MTEDKKDPSNFCFKCSDIINWQNVEIVTCWNCKGDHVLLKQTNHVFCSECKTFYCNGIIETIGNTREWFAENNNLYNAEEIAKIFKFIKDTPLMINSSGNSVEGFIEYLRAYPTKVREILDGKG